MEKLEAMTAKGGVLDSSSMGVGVRLAIRNFFYGFFLKKHQKLFGFGSNEIIFIENSI